MPNLKESERFRQRKNHHNRYIQNGLRLWQGDFASKTAYTRCVAAPRTVGFNRKDPADVLMRVNEIISIDAESDLFVTIFYAIWDPFRKEILYANGGHNPPLLLNSKGDSRLPKAPGIALGVLPTINLKTHSTRLQSGDTLILYTDGVTEAVNEDLDEYGMKRLYLTAKSVRRQRAQEIVQSISDSIHEHAGDTAQFDDVTLVVLKRN